MSLNLALGLYDAARENGGGTFYADGDAFEGKSGYVVGGLAPSLILGLTPNLDASGKEVYVVEKIAEWVDANPSRMYGSWVDAGNLYIDAVDVFDDRDQALDVARSRGELAVWDLANEQEVRVS